MESWRRTVVGIMFEVAAGIAVPSNLLAAGALAASGIVILAWPKLVKKWREPEPNEQNEDDSQSEDSTPKRRIRELTNDEKAMLVEVTSEVLFNHGHNDYVGIHEDILEEKRLSDGLCECGNPRNQFIPFEEGGET